MRSSQSYSEKLRDPRWQRKRLEILSRDKFTCRECGSKTKTLHVHHHYYLRGKQPWEHPTGLLVTLCEGCHDTLEFWKQEILSELGSTIDVSAMGGPECGQEARDLGYLLLGFASDFVVYGDDYPHGSEELRTAHNDLYRAVEKFWVASKAYDAE